MNERHVCAGAHRGQERASAPLELELQEIVSCTVCELGTELVVSKGSK